MAVGDLPEHLQRDLSTVIVHDGHQSSATVVDLSLSGMLVADLALDLQAGDRVTITLAFHDVATTLEGAIVRTVGDGRVGIHFPGTVRDGEFDPPVRLSRIHRALEQAWLQRRNTKPKPKH